MAYRTPEDGDERPLALQDQELRFSAGVYPVCSAPHRPDLPAGHSDAARLSGEHRTGRPLEDQHRQCKAAPTGRVGPLCGLERRFYLILMKMVAKVNRVRDSIKARPRISSS